jgi:hypothetical protein
MNKLFVVLLILVLPLTAFAAMNNMTDIEMAEVSGQMGISIAITDFQQDVNIAAISWGDIDAGIMHINGNATSFGPGYINLNSIDIDKQTTTLYGVRNSNNIIYADPLKIDVVTFSANTPLQMLQNKTAAIISLPDLYQTIDAINIGSISLDSNPSTVTKYAGGIPYVNGGDNTAYYNALNSGGKYSYH